MASLIFLLLLSMSSGILISAPALAEEDCKRITAATSLGSQILLFLGDEYFTFDESFNQISAGKVPESSHLPIPDAMFRSTLDNVDYIFTGKQYYTKSKGYMPADTFGHSSYSFYFQNGLDAGTDLKGTTYMFKNCQVILADRRFGFRPAKLPSGIPCKLDAALTVGDEIWVFKGDKLWHYPVFDRKAEDPLDTLSMLNFNEDINLCPWV